LKIRQSGHKAQFIGAARNVGDQPGWISIPPPPHRNLQSLAGFRVNGIKHLPYRVALTGAEIEGADTAPI
jgi:hypothetical protein